MRHLLVSILTFGKSGQLAFFDYVFHFFSQVDKVKANWACHLGGFEVCLVDTFLTILVVQPHVVEFKTRWSQPVNNRLLYEFNLAQRRQSARR